MHSRSWRQLEQRKLDHNVLSSLSRPATPGQALTPTRVGADDDMPWKTRLRGSDLQKLIQIKGSANRDDGPLLSAYTSPCDEQRQEEHAMKPGIPRAAGGRCSPAADHGARRHPLSALRRPGCLLRRTLLSLSLGLLSLPAWSGDDCNAPVERWQSREAVRQMAAREGWQIQRLKIDDGCYELRGTNAAGQRFKAKIDPETLKVVKMKPKQQSRDRDRERDHERDGQQAPATR